jgi:hypothetical protein
MLRWDSNPQSHKTNAADLRFSPRGHRNRPIIPHFSKYLSRNMRYDYTVIQSDSLIVFLNTANLSHRKPTSICTSHATCHAQGNYGRDALYFTLLNLICFFRFQHAAVASVCLCASNALTEV